MFHRAETHRHRRWPALLSAVVLSSAALTFSPFASAKFGSHEPCVASNGSTLKLLYRVGGGVSIITPACNQVRAGDRWSASIPWIMNTSFEQVPSGFATDWATPLDDFAGKLKSIEYVIDPGSPYSFNRGFGASNSLLWSGELPQAAGLPAANTVRLGPMDPLPIGQHVVDVYWDFAAPHCDGLGSDRAANCLPAGQTLVRRITFDVVAP
jgi:hypothetical protein